MSERYAMPICLTESSNLAIFAFKLMFCQWPGNSRELIVLDTRQTTDQEKLVGNETMFK